VYCRLTPAIHIAISLYNASTACNGGDYLLDDADRSSAAYALQRQQLLPYVRHLPPALRACRWRSGCRRKLCGCARYLFRTPACASGRKPNGISRLLRAMYSNWLPATLIGCIAGNALTRDGWLGAGFCHGRHPLSASSCRWLRTRPLWPLPWCGRRWWRWPPTASLTSWVLMLAAFAETLIAGVVARAPAAQASISRARPGVNRLNPYGNSLDRRHGRDSPFAIRYTLFEVGHRVRFTRWVTRRLNYVAVAY